MVELPPGGEHPNDAAEGDDAVVFVEHGAVELEFVGGGRRSCATRRRAVLVGLPLVVLRTPATCRRC